MIWYLLGALWILSGWWGVFVFIRNQATPPSIGTDLQSFPAVVRVGDLVLILAFVVFGALCGPGWLFAAYEKCVIWRRKP